MEALALLSTRRLVFAPARCRDHSLSHTTAKWEDVERLESCDIRRMAVRNDCDGMRTEYSIAGIDIGMQSQVNTATGDRS